MREVLKKDEVKTPASARFLYNTRVGGIILKIFTSRGISKVAGKFLDSRMSKPLIKRYVKKHGIDMAQYMSENYKSFNAFFTRRIRPELRPFTYVPEEFPSPCDAKLSAYHITDDCTFTVKGFDYTAASLLKNSELAEKYSGGVCLVLRLAVDDYHRYFYIDGGNKDGNTFIKGKLHTVQPVAQQKRRVFSENCREYTVLHTDNFGDVTYVEVGAMMVGRIVNYDGACAITRGEEKGRFEFGGSTIVLLVEKDKVIFDEEFFEETADGNEAIVKCGERIGIKNTAPEDKTAN